MEGEEAGQRRVDEYTQDGTVDLKGNPVLRSKRGGWNACSFVVGTYNLSPSLLLQHSHASKDYRAYLSIVISCSILRNLKVGLIGGR